jgi:aminobenzoyl-glutamate utilization protein B
MEDYAPKLKPFYYNPAKYKTYLEQLGIVYPTVKTGTERRVKEIRREKIEISVYPELLNQLE